MSPCRKPRSDSRLSCVEAHSPDHGRRARWHDARRRLMRHALTVDQSDSSGSRSRSQDTLCTAANGVRWPLPERHAAHARACHAYGSPRDDRRAATDERRVSALRSRSTWRSDDRSDANVTNAGARTVSRHIDGVPHTRGYATVSERALRHGHVAATTRAVQPTIISIARTISTGVTFDVGYGGTYAFASSGAGQTGATAAAPLPRRAASDRSTSSQDASPTTSAIDARSGISRSAWKQTSATRPSSFPIRGLRSPRNSRTNERTSRSATLA